MLHDYGLDWIDQEALYKLTEHAFEKAINARSQKQKNPPDPFDVFIEAEKAQSIFHASIPY